MNGRPSSKSTVGARVARPSREATSCGGCVGYGGRLFHCTPVAAVGAALMAARNRLRLVTVCRKRTMDTGGHTGRPYGENDSPLYM